MSVTVDRTPQGVIHWVHPAHALLLGGTVTLFLGAVVSDIAYMASYEIQWSNFGSWLIVGGLVFGGLAVLWAVADLLRSDRRGRRSLAHVLLLLATWILGFINALLHARDAWASMPAGLVLSIVVAMLACAATWMGFSSLRVGGAE